MVFKHTNPKAAFTLVELMVGVALGMLLLLAVGSLYLFSTRSFVAMSNYSDLCTRNRHASDIISRDVRSALRVASATTNQLVLRSPKGDITYTYNSSAGALSRAQLAETNTLLQGVDSLDFTLYGRPAAGAAYEQLPAAAPANAKLVGFRWSCSRRVLGSQKSSHGVEAAIIELRNQ